MTMNSIQFLRVSQKWYMIGVLWKYITKRNGMLDYEKKKTIKNDIILQYFSLKM